MVSKIRGGEECQVGHEKDCYYNISLSAQLIIKAQSLFMC